MTRLPRILLASALVLVPIGITTAARTSPAAPVALEGNLDDAMQTLQAGQQRIGKTLDKKDVPAALGIVAEMQAAAHSAKLEVPPKAGELKDEAAKAAMVLGYKKQMIEVERALLEIEVALLDNKPEDAKKLVDEKLKPAKKAGHDKYKD